MGDTLRHFRWEWFVPVLLLTTFNDGLRFIKWHFYVRQLGVTNVGWKESMRMFVGGFPLSVTPGKVGEALKGCVAEPGQRAAGGQRGFRWWLLNGSATVWRCWCCRYLVWPHTRNTGRCLPLC